MTHVQEPIDLAEMRALREELYRRTSHLERLILGKTRIKDFLAWLIWLDSPQAEEVRKHTALSDVVAQARVALRESGWGELCHYCDNVATTTDHIVPEAIGGTDHRFNKVPACWDCNQKKADEMPSCKCERCLAAVQYYITTQEERKTA